MKTKVGIAGFGFVGQAVYMSTEEEQDVHIYDPPKGFNDFDTLMKCDFVFCCLPSPTIEDLTNLRSLQDFSLYEEFFNKILDFKDRNKDTIFIVKSTVLYENILPYLSKLNIVMNPEFLNQNSAQYDFENQKWILLGGRADLCYRVSVMYDECFDLEFAEYEFCSEKESIEAKYIHNIYHAYKVLFWNYVQEITGNERRIYELYKKVLKDPTDMARICADGYPGFGGACFPKDLGAFDGQYPHTLTKFMKMYNGTLRDLGLIEVSDASKK